MKIKMGQKKKIKRRKKTPMKVVKAFFKQEFENIWKEQWSEEKEIYNGRY